VSVPPQYEAAFKKSEDIVLEYFKKRKDSPENGTITISDQRYILIRGPALTVEFLELMKNIFGTLNKH
jgi:hypothetical protein